ncbi:hypothetical protein QYF61_009425 [Mycteria americana]|uniref:Uncharacterized protein n=1 Tax=Mycteria americana TaxID=33587 RepID=A0AAN7N289_MYCAM|nr:hypothetical protein QYF61_009425 [Mycteria americana]
MHATLTGSACAYLLPAAPCAEGSRAGLSTPEQSGRISSLDLLAKLLLMQPRIRLAFCAVSAHCRLMSSFLSISIPKSFSSGLLSITSSPSLY